MCVCRRCAGTSIALLLLAFVLGPSAAAEDARFTEFKQVFTAARKSNREGRLGDAVRQYERAVSLAKDLWAADDPKHGPDIANTLHELALVYRDKGEYEKAAATLQESLRIREAVLPRGHADVALSNYELGYTSQWLGLTDKAEAYYTKSLQIWNSAAKPEVRVRQAWALNGLGMLAMARADYAEAERLYRQALAIVQGPDAPKDSLLVGYCKNNLGQYYEGLHQDDKAEEYYQAARKFWEANLSRGCQIDLALTLSNLGMLHRAQKKYAAAEQELKRSLELRRQQRGETHPVVGQTLRNLASLYQEKGDFARAEDLLKQDRRILQERLGPEHEQLANDLNALGELYLAQGRAAEAEDSLRQSCAIREARLRPQDPAIADSCLNLGRAYAALGRWPDAAQSADRARRLLRQHVTKSLAFLPEGEQLLFLTKQDEPSLDAALQIALANRSDQPLAERSASWVVNGKAVTVEVLAGRELLLRASRDQDPEVGKLGRQLLDVQTKLAALTFQSTSAQQKASVDRQLADVQAKELDYSRQLARATRTRIQSRWVDLDEVRGALPADGVLIEIKRLRAGGPPAAGAQAGASARYAAWVIPPAGKGEVQVADLGPADRVEQAVKAARDALTASLPPKGTVISLGEKESERRLRQVLGALARVILEPVAKCAGEQDRWIISADGPLWLVPWIALPLPDGRYAIEKYKISYVVTGRDLVLPPAGAKGQGALVMANPDYDLKLGADGGGEQSLALVPHAPPLPGTALEARGIERELARYIGGKPRLKTGGDALESEFKKLRGPRVVVLSTHGFFLEDDPARRKKLPDKVLLRCGLLLAGANTRQRGADGNDGILTGLEILQTDLRGTELVVLSACETGLGVVRGGQGVEGLRQAFQLAGAQSVVSTLWVTADRKSASLMPDFFRHLADGKPKADALREAQLDLIKSLQEDYEVAHPAYWATHTLTGQWR